MVYFYLFIIPIKVIGISKLLIKKVLLELIKNY